jgi:hypothetical protein
MAPMGQAALVKICALNANPQHSCTAVQACYGIMWPTLGSGIILAVTPSPEQMKKVHKRADLGTCARMNEGQG